VQEGQLTMTPADRDRLVALKKAKKKLITQKEAAAEIGITERQVRRLLKAMRRRGDKAVIHALRGEPSNRKMDESKKEKAIKILGQEIYRGFGPTLASEYLGNKHGVVVSRETVRKWMLEAKLWRVRKQTVEKIHQWRPRRSRYGELVQWDTSEHDWLEGRGEQMYLISMIDDATSKRFARFVGSDSTRENMNVLEQYLQRHGRMLACYTDQASLFKTTEKIKRGEQRGSRDARAMPPTQIERALKELGILWIAAYSPQAKGRVERGFGVAQDRLVKGMRVAGVTTMEQANQYLEEHYLPWCNQTLAVVPANADDAHRRLEKDQDLAAILSHVETRRVANDYTIHFESKLYKIEPRDIQAGLCKADVRVEKRRDGSVAVRFGNRYLRVSVCEVRPKEAQPVAAKNIRPPVAARKASAWNKNFDLKKSMPVWQAVRSNGSRRQETP
jgi:transposase